MARSALPCSRAAGVDTVAEAHALLSKRRDLEASRNGTLAH